MNHDSSSGWFSFDWLSFFTAYKKGQQGKKDQKKKEKEAANQSKDDASAEDDANDVVETIEDDDDEDSGEQDETGAPTVAVTTNGDGESVVEISDSSDDWSARWAGMRENLSLRFGTKYGSNMSAQLQKLARVLKFCN